MLPLHRGSSGYGSTGLGLDIARTAVEAIGGTIHIERGRLNGTRIRLRFSEAHIHHEPQPPSTALLDQPPLNLPPPQAEPFSGTRVTYEPARTLCGGGDLRTGRRSGRSPGPAT
jgi:hypothetical protein